MRPRKGIWVNSMSVSTLDEQINVARGKIEKIMRFAERHLVGDITVQNEIDLAVRHLEDARMRLGVAMTYNKGYDPFSSTANAKRRK